MAGKSRRLKLDRAAGQIFYYDAPGRAAALAAAEAFSRSSEAHIHTDADGGSAFERMLAYLAEVSAGTQGSLGSFIRKRGRTGSPDGRRRQCAAALINYGNAPARALRVRLRGSYREAPAGVTEADVDPDAIEFTVPELGTYLALDLRR